MKVIIAAAGTGGHINPGIAIANKIKKEQPGSEIMFIGTTRGLENDLVPRAGYELKTIDAYGLSKKINLDNIKKMLKTLKGFSQAKKIVKGFNPDIVIGTGGYICGAVITAAHSLKIPTVLHESNAFPGKAVRLLAKKTDTILIGFEEAKNRIKNAKNIVLTGTPVKIKKQNISEEQKRKILIDMGMDNLKPILLVFGGSQGAKAINDAMLKIIKNKSNVSYQIIWAAGPKQYDIIKEELEKSNININNTKDVKIFPYIYNMEEIMNICDLVICRSGAMTITEVSIVGKPAIFVPLPNVSEDHQEYNARVLEKVGAAKIVLNEDLQHINLNNVITELITDKSMLENMGKNANKIAQKDVEDKIYKEIENLLLH